QQFLVVASANPASFERYGMELPEGQWKEVFNSDAAAYGGDGVGNFGKTISGGFQALRIPAHGMLVFQRV
ncbi:MAG: alpha amylase C-terminal domain-containing protein, partial [Myxococcales bacterium]|nr:alpha amylase C-terminal domain-containing protein [Myxococcales bacterium]